jgi:hypothetical protein
MPNTARPSVRRVTGEERRKQCADPHAVKDPHRGHPGADIGDQCVERDGDDVERASRSENPTATAFRHQAAERRPHQHGGGRLERDQ